MSLLWWVILISEIVFGILISLFTLVFNIAQFFLSLNYQLLPHIMDKAGLDCKVSTFFKDYLVGKKRKYLWNNFLSPFCSINVGVGQGSALSPILSAFYLSPIFHIFEKHLKILKYLFQSFFSLMMVYLFPRTNSFHIPMQISFVVITLCLLSLWDLDS